MLTPVSQESPEVYSITKKVLKKVGETMVRAFYRRAVGFHLFFWTILIGAGFLQAFSSLVEAADLPVGSGESLYSLVGNGSAGPIPGLIDGAIGGWITDQETGEAIVNMPVFAKQTSSFGVQLFDASSGEISGEAKLKMHNNKTYKTVTEANGVYLLSGLPAGVYTVWAHENNGSYLKKSYSSSQQETAAETIFVKGGSVVDTINLSLQKGASLEGKIFGKSDRQAIGDVLVKVLDARGSKLVSSTFSDPAGNFVVPGLPDGKYVVKTEKNGFVDSYYGGNKKSQSAETVTISDGVNIQGVDFLLERSVSVAGQAKDADNKALANIRVSIYEYDGQSLSASPVKYVTTGKDGTFLLDNLAPGTYALKADASAQYLPTGYNIKEGGAGLTPLILNDGQKVDGVDVTLALGGIIKGQVVSAGTGLPAKKVQIKVFDSAGKSAGYTSTDNNGQYAVDRLPVGVYTIQALSKSFAAGYYNNITELEAATVVPIFSGSVVENIDFSLTEIPVLYTGSIAGKIVWAYDQSVLAKGCVQAYSILSNKLVGSNCSNQEGRYEITTMPDGDYRLFVRSFAGFISEFYDDVNFKTPDEATPVSILSGANIEGVDFILTKIGGVTGAFFRDSDMKELGTYEIKAAPGSYLVKVTSVGSGYSVTQGTGGERAVAIYDGQTTSAIDFVLSVDGLL